MSYPLSLPASFKSSSVIPSVVFVNSQTVSPFTLESQLFEWSGEQWRFDVSIPPTNDRDTAEDFIAFALRLKGAYGTFLMGDPAFPTPRGAWSGTPLVKGAGQTGNTLVIDGAPNNITNYAKTGDYLQVGTGLLARLYKVMAPANSNSSGEVTLEVSPSVSPTTADNAVITTVNPVGLFRMTSNEVSWGYDSDKMFRYSFSAVAVI